MAIKRRRSRRSFNVGLVAGWLGAALAISALVMAGVVLTRLRAERAGKDPKTLCAAGHIPATYVVLFDSSDTLSALQRVKVRQILDDALFNVPNGARVDVYMATAEAGQLARPLFSKCNPASAQGSPGWNANPQRVREMRLKRYVQPLDAALEKALRANPRRTSPILETIAAATTQSFGRPGLAHPKEYNLIIVSDFLQNSTVLSQYKQFPNVEQFSKQSGWISTAPVLNGVLVKMIYVNRPISVKYQTDIHRTWWCEYFAYRGAVACNIEQL